MDVGQWNLQKSAARFASGILRQVVDDRIPVRFRVRIDMRLGFLLKGRVKRAETYANVFRFRIQSSVKRRTAERAERAPFRLRGLIFRDRLTPRRDPET